MLPFLRGWSEGGPWWPTAIPREGGSTDTVTITDPAKLTAWADDRRGVDNLYFHVNDLSPGTRKKGEKGDVTRIRGLHVDVDPRPPVGGWPKSEPTPERLAELTAHCAAEHARILRLVVDGVGWPAAIPRPTAAVDSGGGCQCFWRLEDDEVLTPELAEALNGALAALLDGDPAVTDVSRIMRLPGAVNLPSRKKRWRGRVDAPTRLVLVDWTRRFRAADFPGPVTASQAAGGRATVTAAPAVGLDLNTLPPGVSDRIRAMIVQGEDPDDPGRYPSRSEAFWAVICAMVRAGCTDEQMLGVILDRDYKISGHVLDQPKPEVYARKQIAKARDEEDNAFVTDGDGNPISNSQKNVRVALRRMGVRLRHDKLAVRATVEGLDGYGPALDDDATTRLWLAIDEQFKFRPQIEFFDRVLSDHARQNTFHPVIDYLDGLRWDGVARIDRWLTTYGGAGETDYTRAVGALFLVAAVRRVRRPGVKFDEMLVLESKQGKDKSTALKVLAVRDEWFTDDLPLNAEGKRVIEALSGKWIVEAGELNGMKKGSAAHLKGFLSRSHDKGRLSYDRREREVPRQCVIVGTTNDSRYLHDTTGNRRFWPVAVGVFDVDALRRDRDQLWAEAAAREAEGVSIRLSKDLWGAAGEEQDARRVEDPFYESLHSALGETLEGKLRSEDAWRIVGRPRGMRTQPDNERLGAAMRRLSFDYKQRRFGADPEWCYVRGDSAKQIVPEFGPDGELTGVGAHERAQAGRPPF